MNQKDTRFLSSVACRLESSTHSIYQCPKKKHLFTSRVLPLIAETKDGQYIVVAKMSEQSDETQFLVHDPIQIFAFATPLFLMWSWIKGD